MFYWNFDGEFFPSYKVYVAIFLNLLKRIYPIFFLMYMCTLVVYFLWKVCRRNVLLPLLFPSRDREKEKSMEFANGSLLGNDSRIFVQHPGAFPPNAFLSLSPSSLSSSRRSSSAHFSFPKFYHPETPAYFILLTFYFALSQFFLWRFLPFSVFLFLRLDASYFLVRILNLSSSPVSSKFLQ